MCRANKIREYLGVTNLELFKVQRPFSFLIDNFINYGVGAEWIAKGGDKYKWQAVVDDGDKAVVLFKSLSISSIRYIYNMLNGSELEGGQKILRDMLGDRVLEFFIYVYNNWSETEEVFRGYCYTKEGGKSRPVYLDIFKVWLEGQSV